MWGFDEAVCISLRESVARRENVSKEFQKCGINIRFLLVDRPAVGGPVYGCYTSHQRVLREAREMGHRRIAVFEDDVYFGSTKEVEEGRLRYLQFAEHMEASSTQWDVFLLGWYPLRAHRSSLRHVLAVDCGGAAHAYIANLPLISAGIPDVLPTSRTEVDMAMFCSSCVSDKAYLKHTDCSNAMKVFALRPMIAFQNMKDSTILNSGDVTSRLLAVRLFPPKLLQYTCTHLPTLTFSALAMSLLCLGVVLALAGLLVGAVRLAKRLQNPP